MTENRMKELQDFAEKFQDQLKEAKELYEQKQMKSKTIEPKHLKTENIKSKINLQNKKKFRLKKLEINDEHWIPNSFFGKSFERFKKLTNQHCPTSWELVNKYNIMFKLLKKIFLFYRQEFL